MPLRFIVEEAPPPAVSMLAHHSRPVCLSFISTDLPILSTLETSATLYEQDHGRFHLLLHPVQEILITAEGELLQQTTRPLLWLELSPHRVVLTRQGNHQFSYRHFWERGIYGISRYWLNQGNHHLSDSFRLRNFTRILTLTGNPLPEFLRIEYELWSDKLCLGHYAVHLEIYH